MKKNFTLLFICVSLLTAAQPWKQPLYTATSNNGITFSAPSTFQDSAGVATLIRTGTSNSDTLLSAFQWFRVPQGGANWDKVAVKFSYNGGTTWTAPKTCTFINLPGGFQRPFDPSLVKMPNGQIKMYFSCGVNNPPAGQIDTYSALSNDGITYTFQPGVIFDDPTKHAIDPSVTTFSNMYYYNSWSSVQSDGAYRAISNDGITFTTQAVFPYDNSHLWLGNYMTDGSTLKFYGCGSVPVWVNSSSDGIAWSGYTVTNINMGADPAVVKNKSGQYVMVYTGAPYTTGMRELNSGEDNFSVFPIPSSADITILSKLNCAYKVEVYDVEWRIIKTESFASDQKEVKVDMSAFGSGIYYINCIGKEKSELKRVIKMK